MGNDQEELGLGWVVRGCPVVGRMDPGGQNLVQKWAPRSHHGWGQLLLRLGPREWWWCDVGKRGNRRKGKTCFLVDRGVRRWRPAAGELYCTADYRRKAVLAVLHVNGVHRLSPVVCGASLTPYHGAGLVGHLVQKSTKKGLGQNTAYFGAWRRLRGAGRREN